MPVKKNSRVKLSPEELFRKIQLDNAFTPVENLPVIPLAGKVLVQYRNARVLYSKLILLDNAKDDPFKNQIVKVVAMGPLCFHSRNLDTGKAQPFNEPPWFKVGDYVRVPQFGLDILYKKLTEAEMLEVKKVSEEARKIPGALFIAEESIYDKDKIRFALLDFHDVKALATDPLDTLNGI